MRYRKLRGAGVCGGGVGGGNKKGERSEVSWGFS